MNFFSKVANAALARITGKTTSPVNYGTASRGAPQPAKEREFLEAFNENPWLRANVAKIMGGIANTTWKVQAKKGKNGKYVFEPDLRFGTKLERTRTIKALQRTGELEDFPDHPLMNLLHDPCPMFGGAQVRQLEAAYCEIAGESFSLVQRTGGMPTAFWPLSPVWVKTTPYPGQKTFTITLPGDPVPMDVPMQLVLWNKPTLDPVNPYGRGSSQARTMADELDTLENASKLVNYAFYNRGRPDLLVTLPGFKPQDVNAFRDEWNVVSRGLSNFFKSHFVNVDAKVERLGQDFEGLQMVDLIRAGRDNVRQSWGLPPEILGILENSNRSTIDAADYLFGKHILLPRLELRREFYQKQVVIEFDDRITLEYESPVQEDKNFQLSVARSVPHIPTVDEWRDMMGWEPAGGEEGKLHIVTSGLVAVKSLEELVAPEPDPNAQQPQLDENGNPIPPELDENGNPVPPKQGAQALPPGGPQKTPPKPPTTPAAPGKTPPPAFPPKAAQVVKVKVKLGPNLAAIVGDRGIEVKEG